MKKVLFVLNNMNIGGTEKAFLNMLDTINPEEYEVTLMLLSKSGGYMSFIPEWVNVECIEGYDTMKQEIMAPPLLIVKEYLKKGKIKRAAGIFFYHCLFKMTDDRTEYYKFVLGKHVNQTPYDIAIAYCGPFDFLTVYVLFFVKALKKIQWIHFDVSKFNFNTKMCKRLYPRFDKICVVSEEARKELVNKVPEIRDKTETYLNVVSKKKCREMAEKGIGYSDNYKGIRIVTVGRLSEEKGQDIIPDVAIQLKRAGIEFRWYLIGDGKLRKEIERKIQEYNLGDKVVLLGTQVNPYPYLKGASLYVQTSIHEGYCITLAEAKAFELPIVSTECAGAHEQLDDCEGCCVVKRDAEQIYEVVKKILKEK